MAETQEQSRLSMLDADGHRLFIIPAEVRGKFQRWKMKIQTVLMLLFLILPWLTVGGEQAVLLDLPHRHFVLLGLHLYAHDAPLIFLLVLGFVGSLALVTALWGRVWCGWACPQTVFIERVYRQIEIWVEGTYLQRRKMLTSPWTLEKFLRKSLKWVLYVLVSSLIAHSFIAYWAGAKTLIHMMQAPPNQNWSYFLWSTSITGILLFNFAWFREQFCLIVCPYGKFQSTLLDSHSINVMYDEKRGEPRKATTVAKNQQGDCVSCQRCVQVCPTGIDIRQGIQMECIGCTACMDACDEIMEKVRKPKGLIRYKAQTEKKIRWFRGRVLAYAGLVAFSFIGLSWALAVRSDIRIEILRAKDLPYQKIEKDQKSWVQNHFVLRLENETTQQQELLLIPSENQSVILPENPVQLQPGQKRDLPMIVMVPEEQFTVMGKAETVFQFQNQKKVHQRIIPLLGPFRGTP
jgi:cytochrome c oxidase accessory protein FixG